MRVELPHLIAVLAALLAAIGALWAAYRGSEKKRADDADAAVKQRGNDVREMVTAVMADVAALTALRGVSDAQRADLNVLVRKVEELSERHEQTAARLEGVLQTLTAGREAAAKAIREDFAALVTEVRGLRAEVREFPRR